MSSSLLITLEMAGVLGVVLLIGGWELWTLRRDKARDRLRERATKTTAGDPPPQTNEPPNAG